MSTDLGRPAPRLLGSTEPLIPVQAAADGEPQGATLRDTVLSRTVPGDTAPSGTPSRRLVNVGIVAACTGVTGLLVGRAAQSVAGDRMAPWILGRASGICAYLLLVALVGMGLLLSHPARSRWRRPSAAVRIRAHVSLAVFTLVFLVLHIVVLATDRYAKVGWWGALLPMASQFRPVAVTLGVVGAYSGLLAGITAALAGRWARRVWWPIHKVAAISLVLVWAHGVMAGADTPTLLWFYLVTAAGILTLAASRYIVRTPGDRVRDLIESELPRAGGDR